MAIDLQSRFEDYTSNRDLRFDSMMVPVATASTIAGLNPGTGRNWVQQGWLSLNRKDASASTPGATTLLSRNRALQMAIAAKLVGMGMHPQFACKAARKFTDQSSPDEAKGFERDPGELYAGAFTALCAYSDGVTAIVRVGRETKFDQIFFPAGGVGAQKSRQEQAIVLLLDFIVKDVDEKLRRFEEGEVI